MWREYQEQHDIKYRLLSFVLQLATSPLEKEYTQLEISPEEEESQIDWRQILREGESSPSPLGSESELSEWSEEEEEEGQTGDDVKRREERVEEAGDVAGEESGPPDAWLREKVQCPYWAQEQTVRVESGQRSANIASITERLREEAGQLDVRTSKLTEYQLTRELLWMLRSPAETPLFTLSNGEFQVAPRITISSLTDVALQNLLSQAIGTINDIHTLRSFIGELEHSSEDIPRTFEAYGCGLSLFLESFSLDLFRLESEVRRQDKTMTALTVLDSLLPWSKMISGYRRVHDVATSCWKEANNWERSIRLLSVLYSSLATNHLPSLLPFLVDTFLRSLEPYLNIINTWLVEGRLEDWRHEFIFFKERADYSDEDEDFWNKVFQSRPYKELLLRQNVVPLKLLDGLDQKILVSGKSVEILYQLDLQTEMVSNDKLPVGLYHEFLDRLEEQLPKKKQVDKSVSLKKALKLDPDFEAILNSTDDPYLARAFQEVFISAQEMQAKSSSDLSTPDLSAPDLLLPQSELCCLLPLETLMARSLSPSIDRHYRSACIRLVKLFKTDLDLESALSRARKVFFLEAGDLMQEFCWQLFSALETEDELELYDSASLTLLLQDCLGTRYPAWADLFSCSLEADSQREVEVNSLSGLRLHMAVAWPLNMILSQQNLLTYNEIFIFLTGVKRSLWALHSVTLHQLESLESSLVGSEEMSASCLLSQDDPQLSLCSGAKQHRLQLLRSWLIFFTSSLHGYFMSRVVHSTELELRDNLQAATDLDQIISVHQLYLQRIYDRCFLHSSVSTFREAVLMVLAIGIDLKRSVVSGLPIHSRTVVAWEEKYRKCHIFLASSLQAMTKKRKVPHLEGLAVTLLHSCPS